MPVIQHLLPANARFKGSTLRIPQHSLRYQPFLSAIITFLMSTSPPQHRGMAFWLMATLHLISKKCLLFLGIGFFVAPGRFTLRLRSESALAVKKKHASWRGRPRVRLVVYIAASFLTGLAVSVSGAVGYVA